MTKFLFKAAYLLGWHVGRRQTLRKLRKPRWF